MSDDFSEFYKRHLKFHTHDDIEKVLSTAISDMIGIPYTVKIKDIDYYPIQNPEIPDTNKITIEVSKVQERCTLFD